MGKLNKSLELSVKKKISGNFSGVFNGFLKGIGNEFDSLREYEFGDSVKNIDWKTTAKQNKVFVKQFEEEKNLKVLFITQNTKSLNFGSETKTKREILEEIFYILAYSSKLSFASIGSFINNKFLDYKKDDSIILKTLNELKSKEVIKNEKLKLNLKNTLIFYISDIIEPNLSELKILNFKNEVIYINIFDYFENNLSLEDFDIDLFSIKNLFSIFGDKNTKNNYIKKRAKNLDTLKKSLRKNDISYLKIDSKDNIFLEFYKFFNEYKK